MECLRAVAVIGGMRDMWWLVKTINRRGFEAVWKHTAEEFERAVEPETRAGFCVLDLRGVEPEAGARRVALARSAVAHGRVAVIVTPGDKACRAAARAAGACAIVDDPKRFKELMRASCSLERLLGGVLAESLTKDDLIDVLERAWVAWLGGNESLAAEVLEVDESGLRRRLGL
jgi:ActR/RegA family two-component response regulator